MPGKVVAVEGLGNIEFPDSMTDEQIAAAIKKQMGGPASAEKPTVGGFIGNALTSTANLVGDAASAVFHPIRTLQAIGAIPVGLWEKAGLPVPKAQPGEVDAAQQLDALMHHVSERYGSWANFRKTMYEDPAGVLADLSTVAGGAGAAADAMKLGKLADVANTVSRVTNPLNAVTAAAGKTVEAVAGPAAQRLYKGALGVRAGSVTPAELRELVATGLQHELPISEGGAQKLNDLLIDMNQQEVAPVVNAAAQRGATVQPSAVANRLVETERKFASQVNPEADLKAIEQAGDEFLRTQGAHPGTPPQPTGVLNAQGQPIMTPGTPARPAQPMPADQAQAIKVGTYQQIKAKEPAAFGTMTGRAKIEAQKALARGIKEELAFQIPELAELNTKEGKLLDLQPVLEAAVNKAGTRRGGGLGPAVVAGVTEGVTKSAPAAIAAGALKTILANPNVRSRLAIAINKAQQLNPQKWGAPSMATAIARVKAYSDSVDAYLANQQASSSQISQ